MRLLRAIVFVSVFLPIPSFGELSPTYYRNLKNAAAEYLKINVREVLYVSTEHEKFVRYSVFLRGTVQDVYRSQSGIAQDAAISVRYETRKNKVDVFGARAIPLLEPGVYTAFLNPSEDGTFGPAAMGYSFEAAGASR